jgi:XTP/dITP diphosphohydrolase
VTARRRIVLSTRNEHKVREFARLLGDEVEIVALPDDVELPPETGETFAENALIKARAAARATNMEAIADDSGIESEALGNAPGVRSARYAGEGATDQENLDKFIAEVPAGSRIRYVCVIAHVDPTAHHGRPQRFEGFCTGTMADAPKGERGFGYDPIFIPDDLDDGRTMAELDDGEKDAISHRGRAARALASWLGSRR